MRDDEGIEDQVCERPATLSIWRVKISDSVFDFLHARAMWPNRKSAKAGFGLAREGLA